MFRVSHERQGLQKQYMTDTQANDITRTSQNRGADDAVARKNDELVYFTAASPESSPSLPSSRPKLASDFKPSKKHV